MVRWLWILNLGWYRGCSVSFFKSVPWNLPGVPIPRLEFEPGNPVLTSSVLLSKGKVKVVFVPWRRIGGVEIYLYTFLTSALDGGEWSDSHPDCFILRERTHWIGGWVGPRAHVYELAKIEVPVPTGYRTPSHYSDWAVSVCFIIRGCIEKFPD